MGSTVHTCVASHPPGRPTATNYNEESSSATISPAVSSQIQTQHNSNEEMCHRSRSAIQGLSHDSGNNGVQELLGLKITRAEESYGAFYVRHTNYIIEYLESGKPTYTSRRYKEFVTLHADLLSHCSSLSLPELPAKRYFGNFEPPFIELRRNSLECYLLLLIRNSIVLKSDIFWNFLNADVSTIVVARFLSTDTLLIEQPFANVYRVVADGLKLSYDTSFTETSQDVLLCVSHPLVISKIIKVGSIGNIVSKGKVCLMLKALLGKEDSRHYLVQSDAFGVAISILEQLCQSPLTANSPGVAVLSLLDGAREFCYRFVDTCPQIIALYLRLQDGMQQFLSLLRVESFVEEIHSFVSLLLWSAIHLQEVQKSLTENGSTGMAVLAALYHSRTCNARIACGLILAKLLKSNSFETCEVIQQAAASIEQLPRCVQDMSCMCDRTAIPSTPNMPTISDDRPSCVEYQYSENPTEIHTQGLSEIIQNAAYVRNGREERMEYLSGMDPVSDKSNNKNNIKSSLSAPYIVKYPLRSSRGIDYFFLYVLWRGRNQQHFTFLLSGGESDNEHSEVMFFTLWFLTMLLSRSRHTHHFTPNIVNLEYFDSEPEISPLLQPLRCNSFTHPNDFTRNHTQQLRKLYNSIALPQPNSTSSPTAPSSHFIAKRPDPVISTITAPVCKKKRISSLMCNAVQRRFEGEDMSCCDYFSHDTLYVSPRDIHAHTHSCLEATLHNSFLYGDLLDQADTFCALVATQHQAPKNFAVSLSAAKNNTNSNCTPHLILEDPALSLMRMGIVATVAALLLNSTNQSIKNLASVLLIYIPWVDKNKAAAHPNLLPLYSDETPKNDPQQASSFRPHSTDCNERSCDKSGLCITPRNGSDNEAWKNSMSKSMGTTLVATNVSGGIHRRNFSTTTTSSVIRSFVSILEPPICVIPQQLLSQRLCMSKTLIDDVDKQISIAKNLLKVESEKLSEKDQFAGARINPLGFEEDQVALFLSAFRRYKKMKDRLQEVPVIARNYLSQMRLRVERQVMTRESLSVEMSEFFDELEKIGQMSLDIEVSYAEAAKKENDLFELKAAAENHWQALIESNAKLREVQAELRAAKQQSARFRMHWMEMEQVIVDAPRRRQQLSEQILERGFQLVSTEEKLQKLKQLIVEEQKALMRLDRDRQATEESILTIREIRHSFADWVKNYDASDALLAVISPKSRLSARGPRQGEPTSAKSECLEDVSRRSNGHKHRYHSADGGRDEILAASSTGCDGTLNDDHGSAQGNDDRSSRESFSLKRGKENNSQTCVNSGSKVLPMSHSGGDGDGSRGDASSPIMARIRLLHSRLPSECRSPSRFNELLEKNAEDQAEVVDSFRNYLGEAENILRSRREEANGDSHHKAIRHLSEKQRRQQSKMKKLEAEIQQLKSQLDVQSNPEALVKKSEELQAIVRQKDLEVETKNCDLLEIHGCSKDIERQLERKKGEMRQKETEFSTARELLNQLVENCNNYRRKLCSKILTHESGHRQLLSDLACSREDGLYMSTNRYALDLLLLRERKVRLQFRSDIADLMTALRETDDALAKIDDTPLSHLESSSELNMEPHAFGTREVMFPGHHQPE